jgi:flagellar hook-basal body complex protein FliE
MQAILNTFADAFGASPATKLATAAMPSPAGSSGVGQPFPQALGLTPGLQSGSVSTQSVAPAPFSDLLSSAVGQVNQLEDQARTTVTGLMSGTGVDVHQAMIATEKASMAFELTLAVRNKAVQAYQSVVGMQF